MTVIIPGILPEPKRTLDSQTRVVPPLTGDSAATQQRPVDSVSTVVRNDTLDVAAATEQTIAQNNTAALSTLSDNDFAALEATPSPQATVQSQSVASVAAQTNRLAPSMLELLVE